MSTFSPGPMAGVSASSSSPPDEPLAGPPNKLRCNLTDSLSPRSIVLPLFVTFARPLKKVERLESQQFTSGSNSVSADLVKPALRSRELNHFHFRFWLIVLLDQIHRFALAGSE